MGKCELPKLPPETDFKLSSLNDIVEILKVKYIVPLFQKFERDIYLKKLKAFSLKAKLKRKVC